MALVLPSALISDIRGQIGGSVFQGSNAGLIIRNNTTPINKKSSSQIRNRNFMQIILTQWTVLTQTQRDTWSNFVQYTKTKQKNFSNQFISGQQLFILINNYRLNYDLSILQTPQFNKCDIQPITLTTSSDGITLTITASRALVPTDEFIILFMTIRLRNSINNPGTLYKLLNFATVAGPAINVTTSYLNVFGRVPQPGETIFFKYTNASKNTGLPFAFKSDKVSL